MDIKEDVYLVQQKQIETGKWIDCSFKLETLEKGNVIINLSGRKEVIRKPRELKDGEKFHCVEAHEDGDYSYLCTNQWCRCSA